MFIAGRPLQIDGKTREPGLPVPEAETWPAHVLSCHIKLGSVRIVSEETAQKEKEKLLLEKATHAKSEKDKTLLLLRDKIDSLKSEQKSVESRSSQIKSDLTRLEIELQNMLECFPASSQAEKGAVSQEKPSLQESVVQGAAPKRDSKFNQNRR